MHGRHLAGNSFEGTQTISKLYPRKNSFFSKTGYIGKRESQFCKPSKIVNMDIGQVQFNGENNNELNVIPLIQAYMKTTVLQ